MSPHFPFLPCCFCWCSLWWRWRRKCRRVIAWTLQRTVLLVFTPSWGFAGRRTHAKDPLSTNWGRNWSERWAHRVRTLGQGVGVNSGLDRDANLSLEHTMWGWLFSVAVCHTRWSSGVQVLICFVLVDLSKEKLDESDIFYCPSSQDGFNDLVTILIQNDFCEKLLDGLPWNFVKPFTLQDGSYRLRWCLFSYSTTRKFGIILYHLFSNSLYYLSGTIIWSNYLFNMIPSWHQHFTLSMLT